MKKNTCPVCGKQIKQGKHVDGGRPKRFCSPHCRNVYHCRASEARKRGAEVAPDGHPLRPGRKCCVCGKEIDPRKNERTVCCSDVCSMRRSNRLRRGAPVGEEEYRAFIEKRMEAHKAERKSRSVERRTARCVWCGKEFVRNFNRPDAVYCSRKCAACAREAARHPGRNVSASKVRKAEPNRTFVQKREPVERDSVARVEACLRLPASERFAQLETLTKKEQAMAREMWMRLKCQRPVYYTAMAN